MKVKTSEAKQYGMSKTHMSDFDWWRLKGYQLKSIEKVGTEKVYEVESCYSQELLDLLDVKQPHQLLDIIDILRFISTYGYVNKQLFQTASGMKKMRWEKALQRLTDLFILRPYQSGETLEGSYDDADYADPNYVLQYGKDVYDLAQRNKVTDYMGKKRDIEIGVSVGELDRAEAYAELNKTSPYIAVRTESYCVNKDFEIYYEELVKRVPNVMAVETLNEDQMHVVDLIGEMDKDIFSLNSRGGTGKTYLISKVAPYYDYSPSELLFMAPTNKAVGQLATKGGNPNAKTVTKALMYHEKNDHDVKIEINDEVHEVVVPKFSPITVGRFEHLKLIVLDEASMVNQERMERIKDKLKDANKHSSDNCKLVMMGDAVQLKPVEGETNIDFTQHADFELTRSMRTADEVLRNFINGYREGRSFAMERPESDRIQTFNRIDESIEALKNVDVVLCYTNKNVNFVNSIMRSLRGYTDHYPQVGDILMATSNFGNFENSATYKVTSRSERELDGDDEWGYNYGLQGVEDGKSHKYHMKEWEFELNYTPGKVLSVDHLCRIPNKEDEDYYKKAALTPKFVFGYSMTVHKSQGSDWDNVAVYYDTPAVVSFDEETSFLYTAVSRAKEDLVLIGFPWWRKREEKEVEVVEDVFDDVNISLPRPTVGISVFTRYNSSGYDVGAFKNDQSNYYKKDAFDFITKYYMNKRILDFSRDIDVDSYNAVKEKQDYFIVGNVPSRGSVNGDDIVKDMVVIDVDGYRKTIPQLAEKFVTLLPNTKAFIFPTLGHNTYLGRAKEWDKGNVEAGMTRARIIIPTDQTFTGVDEGRINKYVADMLELDYDHASDTSKQLMGLGVHTPLTTSIDFQLIDGKPLKIADAFKSVPADVNRHKRKRVFQAKEVSQEFEVAKGDLWKTFESYVQTNSEALADTSLYYKVMSVVAYAVLTGTVSEQFGFDMVELMAVDYSNVSGKNLTDVSENNAHTLKGFMTNGYGAKNIYSFFNMPKPLKADDWLL
jgi:exodeoxyribonuclease-5